MKTEVLTNSTAHAREHNSENSTHTHFAGKAAGTILLAMAFLALVMFLSYLFINGAMK